MTITKYISTEIKKLNAAKFLTIFLSNVLIANLLTSLFFFYTMVDETEQILTTVNDYFDFYNMLYMIFSTTMIIPVLSNYLTKFEQSDSFLQNISMNKSKYLNILFAKFSIIFISMLFSLIVSFGIALIFYQTKFYFIGGLDWSAVLRSFPLFIAQSYFLIPLIIIPLLLASELRLRVLNILIPIFAIMIPLYILFIINSHHVAYTPYTLATRFIIELSHNDGAFNLKALYVILYNALFIACILVPYLSIISNKKYNLNRNKLF